MRQRKNVWTCGLVWILGVGAGASFAHPGHASPEEQVMADAASSRNPGAPLILAEATEKPAATPSRSATTGEGKYKFRLLYTGDHLPAKAVEVLKKAHGGFAVDRRRGKGEIYFALPGAGIIQISRDLSSTKLIDTAAEVRDLNLHNTLFWIGPDKTPYLTFPANDAGKVFTMTLDGKLLHTLSAPTGEENLGSQGATEYFRKKLKFAPTDVEQLDGLYYITTGYCDLDSVLTAKLSFAPFEAKWNALTFGGRGTGPGQFGTGHGITIPAGKKRLDVADRPNSEIDRFSPEGKYLSTLPLPKGSLPCDTCYLRDVAVIGCLEGPDKKKGAPIYILENDKLVSTLMPKEDLGLANFTHVHNAIGVMVKRKLFIIAQAWNPGDFAILEQVSE